MCNSRGVFGEGGGALRARGEEARAAVRGLICYRTDQIGMLSFQPISQVIWRWENPSR